MKSLFVLLLPVFLFARVVVDYDGIAAIIPSYHLTNVQYIRDFARQNPSRSGMTWEDTASAIYLTESSTFKPEDGKIGDWKPGMLLTQASLGWAQMQVQTLHCVIRHHNLSHLRTKTDRQLANMLLSNDPFALEMLVLNVTRLADDPRRRSYFNKVSGYNGGFRNHRYWSDFHRNLGVIHQLKEMGAIR